MNDESSLDELERENAELRAKLADAEREINALTEWGKSVDEKTSKLFLSMSEQLDEALVEVARLREAIADVEKERDEAKSYLLGCNKHRLWRGDACIGCVEVERDEALARAEAAEKERDDWKTKWENLSDDALKEFELSGFLTDDAKSGEGFFDFLIRTRAERYAALARAEAAEKERDEAKKWSSVEEVTRLRILAEHNRKEWEKSIARAEAAEREDGGLVDQFLHRLLDEVTRRGIDMSNCDGEDPPEIVIAGWLCGYVSDIKQERDTALAEVARLRGVISETERKHFSTL